jgi:hypothetical protein
MRNQSSSAVDLVAQMIQQLIQQIETRFAATVLPSKL